MNLLPIALICAIGQLCSSYAAYIAVEDPSIPWTSFQDAALPVSEGLLLAPLLHDLDSHYLCDVVIGNEAFQISVHSASPNTWIPAPTVERILPSEYVNLINDHFSSSSHRPHFSPPAHSPSNAAGLPAISCRRPADHSVLQQRIGFMHVIDFLSILGVGFLAAVASSVAALLRRRDHHLKRPDSAPPMVMQWGRLDHLHERPSLDNRHETEYVFSYIKSKLG